MINVSLGERPVRLRGRGGSASVSKRRAAHVQSRILTHHHKGEKSRAKEQMQRAACIGTLGGISVTGSWMLGPKRPPKVSIQSLARVEIAVLKSKMISERYNTQSTQQNGFVRCVSMAIISTTH